LYSLKKLNVVKIVATESRRDALLAQGFTLLHVETKEPAAAPAEPVEMAPAPPKPKRAAPRKRTR
jgi:hypothetical protein